MKPLPVAVIVLAGFACVDTNFWPVENTGIGHPVGNSSREFQFYGGVPYYHSGIDVTEPAAPGGPWLRSVDSGTVVISFSASPMYHGIIITDPDTISYGYWHVDSASITTAVWNAWTGGTRLALDVRMSQIAFWAACAYHHVHFFRRTPSGETDPMIFVRPNGETARPTVTEVRFAQNATDTYFTGTPPTVSGDVDIVAQISDSVYTTTHLVGVYDVKVRVQRRIKIWFLTFWWPALTVNSIFAPINTPPGASASVVFKTNPPRQSNSNYCGTEVNYYVVTNGVASSYNDGAGFWDTDGGGFPNGRYRVKVTARDASGNASTRTQLVDVTN